MVFGRSTHTSVYKVLTLNTGVQFAWALINSLMLVVVEALVGREHGSHQFVAKQKSVTCTVIVIFTLVLKISLWKNS